MRSRIALLSRRRFFGSQTKWDGSGRWENNDTSEFMNEQQYGKCTSLPFFFFSFSFFFQKIFFLALKKLIENL